MINFISKCVTCSESFDPADADSTLKVMQTYGFEVKTDSEQDAFCSKCLINKERLEEPEYMKSIRDAVDQSSNICCVGAAGSGKSVVLRKITQQLRFRTPSVIFDVLCPTGCSAVNVDGITLHSLFCWSNNGKIAHGMGNFFGLSCSALAAGKISRETIEDKLAVPLPRYKNAIKRIKELNAICFDEFSMISGEHLKAMDSVAKGIKCNWKQPFGGIQILMFGDPFQNLPPQGKAPFSHPVWKTLGLNIFEIQSDKLYRFTTSEFSDMTRMLRLGIVSEVVESRIMTRAQKPEEKIMELYFTNKDAEKHNLTRYADLKEEEYSYPSNLKLGLTLLEENKDKKLTSNKTIVIDGPVEGKFTAEQLAVVGNKNVLKHANEQLEQYRRILATVYGAEYMNMKFKPGCRIICTVNHRENGRFIYCNGSAGIIRSCSSQGAVVDLDDERKIEVNYKTIESCRRIRLDEGSFIDMKLCFNHIPFRLGYAITFNRSQGMTLNKVKVNGHRLKKNTGMLYVGLSRCRNLEGMYLDGISLSKIKASSEAIVTFQDHVINEVRHLYGAHPEWFDKFQVQNDDAGMLQRFIEVIHCVKTGVNIAKLDKVVNEGDLVMPNIEAGNKVQLTKVRNQSQRELRKWLIKHQSGCLISGEKILAALDVAHIKPYSEFNEEELKTAHMNNGMLMRKDLHALYDKGYFTIDDEGKLIKSKSFELSDSYRLFERADLKPFMSREHLQWHRENVFTSSL
jgi:HNH endonuclease/PIF1-like helicase